jgi:hypothetical protein
MSQLDYAQGILFWLSGESVIVSMFSKYTVKKFNAC